jgi:ABC-type sugar transport system substrate-binding protein
MNTEGKMKKNRIRSGASAGIVALLAAALAFMTVPAASASARSHASHAPAATKGKIVWLELGAGNPYWTDQHNAAAVIANRAGYSFQAVSGNLDPSYQANELKTLAAEHPSVIMVNPLDPATMGPALKYAKQKGVPVLSLYAPMSGATASVYYNEIRSGKIDAKYAVTLLKQRYGQPEGQVAVLEGVLGQPASDQRAGGFINYVKAHDPKVKIVATAATGWGADQATAATQDWLTKYPHLSMIYGLSDTISIPGFDVAARESRACTQQKNWTKNASCVAFVSVDGFFIGDVASGQLFSDELYSPFWFGATATAMAVRIAEHKSVQHVKELRSLLTTPTNGVCVNKMETAMSNVGTFNWGASPSLQGLAAKRGCKVLDANE